MDTEKNKIPEAAITQARFLDDHWISGKTGTFYFKAKVYKEGSQFGINGGNVSKLAVWPEGAPMVASYDRGWDVWPKNAEVQKIVGTILDYCRHVYGQEGGFRPLTGPKE